VLFIINKHATWLSVNQHLKYRNATIRCANRFCTNSMTISSVSHSSYYYYIFIEREKYWAFNATVDIHKRDRKSIQIQYYSNWKFSYKMGLQYKRKSSIRGIQNFSHVNVTQHYNQYAQKVETRPPIYNPLITPKQIFRNYNRKTTPKDYNNRGK